MEVSDKIEYETLEAKLVGSDTVVFKLEDGTQVKIRVSIVRAGVATNYKNPDGTPSYSIQPNIQVTFVPSSKKFYLPKHSVPTPPKESEFKPI
jgi:hypothetical protein